MPDAAQEDRRGQRGAQEEGVRPQRRRHQEGLGRGPSHGEDQRRGRDDLLHGDDVLVVRERHAVHRGLRRGDRRAPSGHPHGVQVPPRRQVRGREGQSVRAEGGSHHQVGVDQAPRGHPGVRAVGVRGVRDHAARGARGHPRDQRQVPGGRQRGREDTGPLRPRRSGRVRVGEGLQRGREARGHQHELGEPQREVGGLGVQEAAEEDLGTEPVRDPRHAPGGGASRVLKKYVRYLQHGKRNAGRLQTRPRRRERARAHPPHAGTR